MHSFEWLCYSISLRLFSVLGIYDFACSQKSETQSQPNQIHVQASSHYKKLCSFLESTHTKMGTKFFFEVAVELQSNFYNWT